MKIFNGRKLLSFGFIAVLSALMLSCFSVPHSITFDETVPKERSAEVLFGEGIHVLTLNGVDVDEEWYGEEFWSNESARVTIPAGEASVEYDLLADISNGRYSTTFQAEGLKLIYSFEAGSKYELAFESRGGFLGIGATYGIALYEGRNELEFWQLDF
jgi:hypothetical protein